MTPGRQHDVRVRGRCRYRDAVSEGFVYTLSRTLTSHKPQAGPVYRMTTHQSGDTVATRYQRQFRDLEQSFPQNTLHSMAQLHR